MADISTPILIDFLKKIHLFRGLNDKELQSVAEEMKDKRFDEAGTVFIEGTPADSFYIVYDGRVHITRRGKDRIQKVATLVKGDYFGEQGLIKGTNRSATVKADAGTVLLILYRQSFKRILTKVPGLWPNFDIMMRGRGLANRLRFPWLMDGEVIYFLGRKHSFLLLRSLIVPALVLIPIIALMGLAYVLSSIAIGAIGGALLVLDLAWGVWLYVDWGNDFYIVTNERVAWIEKVIGLYDSRNEADMNTLLSVSTETDYWGRVLDYGTVVVRTFTGQIRMDYVSHPKQAQAMIEEYWNRSKSMARVTDENIMKQAILKKLGVTPAAKPAPPAPAPASTPVKAGPKPSTLENWWQNAFKMRVVDGSTVTYHKHVFVLFRDESPYIGGIILIIAVILAWPMIFGVFLPTWLISLLLLAILVLLGFIIYQYEDWKNDIFQVTPDQIIDVYKKPFGVEDRRAAPLEGILSSEYKRNGLIEILLNFGTVYINVGGAKFDFEDVMDPPSVQQDIVRRQQARVLKKKEAEGAAERDRMAEWLAMYHRTLDEIEREKKQSRPSNPE